MTKVVSIHRRAERTPAAEQLREIADLLERGEVDNVACSFVTREGAVGTFFVLVDERERPWELLGAVEYLKAHLVRSLDE